MEKRKKSVDKILTSKKVYLQTSSLLSKNTRATQEITRNDSSMPFRWTATHYKGDTQLFVLTKKRKKTFFLFFVFSKLWNRSQVPQKLRNTLYNAHIACAHPPCRYQRKTTHSLFIRKRKKKDNLIINKSYRKMAKSSMKTVSHSLMMERLSLDF